MSFIKDLGKRIARQSGDPKSTAFLLQRLSVAIQLSLLWALGLPSPLLFDIYYSVFSVLSVLLLIRTAYTINYYEF